ncbi:ParB/RepB/Spo0J family partition protein [Rugamonas sp. A1-17]|nr:ParB/RepB/Spo0J family partition protein [Rugamonas sp. A1-17]
MSNTIKKGDMASRALGAAASTPGISQRFAHARELAGNSPAAPLVPAAVPMLAPTVRPEAPVNVTVVAGSETLETVELEKIDQNPYNARKVYRLNRISELAASIGANGQDTPGIATIRDGRYVLVAGHYRYKALRMLGNRPMLLLIRPGLTDREMYEMSFRENVQREDQSALDNALSWKELLNKGVYASETEISDVTGYSLPNINKTMAVLRLNETVLAIIREEPTKFKFSVVYELVLFGETAKDAGLEDTLTLARGVLAGDVTRKAIQEARERLEKPAKQRKTKETARTYNINTAGIANGSLKTWDSGKVSLDVMILDPVARHALLAELRERFGLAE